MSVNELFNEFASQKYSVQAQSFLNAYWDEVNGDAEKFWEWTSQFALLDLDNKEEGCNLDEFNAHRFLEKNSETKTVKELREELREIDLNFDKRIALIEYLLFRYKKSVKDFVSRPQGDNSKEIEKAQQMIDEVQDALNEANRRSEEAKASEKEAKKRADEAARTAQEADRTAKEATRTAEEATVRQNEATRTAEEATKRADEATASANEALQAENEQREALAEVQAQEDARNKKTEDLTQKSEDENLGLVARNRAKNELAQHLSEDSLPLRRAKITLEAATKKAMKARLRADEAKDEADKAKEVADKAKSEADKAKSEADRAKSEADRAKAEADEAKAQAESAARAAEETAKAAAEAVKETERKL